MQSGESEEDTLKRAGRGLAVVGAALTLALLLVTACRTDDIVMPEPTAERAAAPATEPDPANTPLPAHMATQIAARAEGYKTIWMVTGTEPGVYAFQPNRLTLEQGDNVRLLLKGRVEPEGYGYHTFTLPSQGFSVLVPERTKSVWLSFDEPGEFEFYCIPHPWMRGTITVLPEGELPDADSG